MCLIQMHICIKYEAFKINHMNSWGRYRGEKKNDNKADEYLKTHVCASTRSKTTTYKRPVSVINANRLNKHVIFCHLTNTFPFMEVSSDSMWCVTISDLRTKYRSMYSEDLCRQGQTGNQLRPVALVVVNQICENVWPSVGNCMRKTSTNLEATNAQTDRQTNRWTDGRTDRYTHTHAHTL